jgi:hypothetical protein
MKGGYRHSNYVVEMTLKAVREIYFFIGYQKWSECCGGEALMLNIADRPDGRGIPRLSSRHVWRTSNRPFSEHGKIAKSSLSI